MTEYIYCLYTSRTPCLALSNSPHLIKLFSLILFCVLFSSSEAYLLYEVFSYFCQVLIPLYFRFRALLKHGMIVHASKFIKVQP